MASWTSAVTPTSVATAGPLSFTTANVNDIVWAAAFTSSATGVITFSCADVSGGFAYFGASQAMTNSSGFSFRMGWGTVTTAGSTTIAASATAGTIGNILAGEITPPVGTTSIAQDGTQSYANGTATTIAYPSLVPSGASDFYLGFVVPEVGAQNGTTTGFSYYTDATTSAQVAYSLDAPNPSAPTAPYQFTPVGWDVIAALLIPTIGAQFLAPRPLIVGEAGSAPMQAFYR